MGLCLMGIMLVRSHCPHFYLEEILTQRTDSKRILPPVFNSFLDTQEAKASKALKKVADDKGNFRQRQGSPTWGSR
jgi:hypothetical protein